MLLLFMLIPVIIFAAIVIYFVSIYNGLVKGKNAAVAAWHQIDVQLTRRADLVENLVETVKGYAAHEKTVFENVAAARSSVKESRGARQAGKHLTRLILRSRACLPLPKVILNLRPAPISYPCKVS
jgi:LemA protein